MLMKVNLKFPIKWTRVVGILGLLTEIGISVIILTIFGNFNKKEKIQEKQKSRTEWFLHVTLITKIQCTLTEKETPVRCLVINTNKVKPKLQILD